MRYEIVHSGIACALMVFGPDGRQYSCYYMSKDRPIQEGVEGSEARAEERFKALPLEVRAAVSRQFGEVFSLPSEQRAAWIKAQVPFFVETIRAE